MTLPPANGHIQGYLNDLARIQTSLDTVQRQISSGVRVGVASDDPDAVAPILRGQAEVMLDEQTQTNLNRVKADLNSGDSALQQGAKLMDQAVSIAAQAASSSMDPTRYPALLQQARSLQDSVVALASTQVNGRYIFSGDRDTGPLYTQDATQPNGVRQLAPATSTISIPDRNGATVWRPITATEIFDSGDATSGNVFAAIAGLVSALEAKNPAAAQAAAGNLQTASDHLNQQLGLYGIAETRVADALNDSSQAVITEKQDVSTNRDSDLTAAAIQLGQLSLQQQSALSIGARISQRSLFDYLA